MKINKKNILITGARAPIAVDWAFRLKSNSTNRVIMADSAFYPLGRFSKYLDAYYRVGAPRQSPQLYIKDILHIVNREKIELIIPTCEEIFYLASFKNLLPKTCQLFADDFEKLSLLHNKWLFIESIKTDIVKKPKSFYINSTEDFNTWKAQQELNDYILKPVFSRFGSEVIFNLNEDHLRIRYPAVIQEKLEGEELCSYSIVISGNILAHSCYHPKYKAGPGAGIYFEPRNNRKIFSFVKDYVKQINFTGQIAFDFFDNNGEVYPFECNPRGTSGLHLIDRSIDFLPYIMQTQSLENELFDYQIPQACQIKLAMLIYASNNIKINGLRSFIKDYRDTPDLYELLDSKALHAYQLISFMEIFIKSFKARTDLKRASTEDIEWDGNRII